MGTDDPAFAGYVVRVHVVAVGANDVVTVAVVTAVCVLCVFNFNQYTQRRSIVG